jgi:hypothetical protein
MPHQAALPDGMIALWGKTTLEPLDQDSIKILGEGKSPKKGLLVDFIGNFARSAKEGLCGPLVSIRQGAELSDLRQWMHQDFPPLSLIKR